MSSFPCTNNPARTFTATQIGHFINFKDEPNSPAQINPSILMVLPGLFTQPPIGNPEKEGMKHPLVKEKKTSMVKKIMNKIGDFLFLFLRGGGGVYKYKNVACA